MGQLFCPFLGGGGLSSTFPMVRRRRYGLVFNNECGRNCCPIEPQLPEAGFTRGSSVVAWAFFSMKAKALY